MKMTQQRRRILLRRPKPSRRAKTRFEKRLRRYDPNLFMHFNEIRGRWQVWRTSPLNPWCEPAKFVMAIETRQGRFKTPDDKDLETIIRYDLTLEGLAKRAFQEDRKRLAKKLQQDESLAEKNAAEQWEQTQTAERRYAILETAKSLLHNRVTVPMGRLATRGPRFGRTPL